MSHILVYSLRIDPHGQVLPTGRNSSNSSVTSSTKMPPPPTAMNSSGHTVIAPQPVGDLSSYSDESDGKRLQKRAANRRSAQLSRKRKKVYIEELKDENEDLRRKEQILRSIPDLVVVFDSSGKICFVSESVSRFLSFTTNELEGKSFWERICQDSVRLLKAAFMDSLAARQDDSDTAPLGSGVWELRLVDKDGSQKVVTLNGVVHFAGDRPECVCCIRPRDEHTVEESGQSPATSSLPSRSIMHVHPQQSVVSNSSSDSPRKKQKIRKGRDSVRISDSGNTSSGSGESESGSSDEMLVTN